MKIRPAHQAFTLLELMTVLAVIVIITAMVVGVAGLVQTKTAKARAVAEMSMLAAAAERYKSENGSYPQSAQDVGDSPDGTNKLSPMEHFQPSSSEYGKASLFFYKELTGDTNEPCDGIPEDGAPSYLKEFDPRILKKTTTGVGASKAVKVEGFQDPFGYFYGYSTAAAFEESEYRVKLRKPTGKPPVRKTGADARGFNSTSFDLWSTAGSSLTGKKTSATEMKDEQAKWLKNW